MAIAGLSVLSCAQGGSPNPSDASVSKDVIHDSSGLDSDVLDHDQVDPDPLCAQACHVVGTCLTGPTAYPPPGHSSWECLDRAGGCKDGQCKIWCPHDNTIDGPQYTEACYLDDAERNMNYEDACRSCCERFGAVWNSDGHYCAPPPSP